MSTTPHRTHKRPRGRVARTLTAALLAAGSLFVVAPWSQGAEGDETADVTAASTLVVDTDSPIREVSQVGNGMLYGLSDADTPPVDTMLPLNLNQLRQPPPNHEHIPNQETEPVGDTLDVAANAAEAGANITVDMADTYNGFPYYWEGWDDWLGRIDRMIADLEAADPAITNVNAWEPWNEPDGTWHQDAGPFTDGWARSVERIKQSDPDTPITGPSYSHWNRDTMRDFLIAAQESGTVPDIINWHELSGWQGVSDHIRDYRALEQELGIGPLPISIGEYAGPEEVDQPSTANHYVAQFEREGVRDAQRTFWYEAGTLNGLLHNNEPTASYWMYQWYGEQTGDIVDVTPTEYNDAVAAYDADAKEVSVVFGGEAGDNAVQVDGLDDFGSSVTASLEYTPGSGRHTNVDAPTQVSTETLPVTDGSVTVPVTGQDHLGAYRVVLTPAGG